MAEKVYQLVASTPQRSNEGVERIANNLGDSFQIDLGGLINSLSTTGVCVTQGDSVEAIRQQTAMVLQAGADFIVLDDEGNVVDSGLADPDFREGTAGFALPDLGSGGKIEMEEAGGWAAPNATIGDGGVDVTDTSGGGNMELDHGGGFAAPDSTIGDGAVDLGGTAEGKIELEGHGGYAATGAPITQGGLELTEPGGELQLTDATDLASDLQQQGSGKSGLTGRLREVSTGSLVMIDGSTNVDGYDDGSGAFRPEQGNMGTLTTKKGPDELGFVDNDLGIEPTGVLTDELRPPAGLMTSSPGLDHQATVPAVSQRPLTRPSTRVPSTRRARRAAAGSGFKLFGGGLRYRPYTRVILGFLIALAAGSGFAVFNAKRVLESRIAPIRQELSDVKAHGEMAISYTPPADLESQIASILKTNRIMTMLVWAFLMALLLYFWFRFT